MIRALIVDDEYLSRRGMMLTIPWEKYGIQIIGEADSAESAMDFLSCHDVELLLTDITMPRQSGFDLIRLVTLEYPAVSVVVITCHQDFNYIQQALRMGAIDYIVKTELEQAALDECLSRIAHKVLSLSSPAQKEQPVSYDTAILLHSLTLDRPAIPRSDFCPISEQIFLDEKTLLLRIAGTLEEDFLKAAVSSPKQILLLARDVSACSASQLTGFFKNYMHRQLFYQYSPAVSIYMADFKARRSHSAQETAQTHKLQESWSSLRWLYDQNLLTRLKQETVQAQLGAYQLKRILFKAFHQLEQYTSITLSDQLYTRLENIEFWIQCEELLADVQTALAAQFNHSAYPDETFQAILQSVEYIKAHFTESLNQDSISRKFHLSRSYFSRAFKDIVGTSFTDYIHELRMKEARRLLLQKNTPVFSIAYELGFRDEKYFSKTFKKYWGLTPMEFRSQNSGIRASIHKI